MDTTLYKAYDRKGTMLCWAGRLVEKLEDGMSVVGTGSAKLIAHKIEPLAVGDVLSSPRHGGVIKIKKINRKSVVIRQCGPGIEQKVEV